MGGNVTFTQEHYYNYTEKVHVPCNILLYIYTQVLAHTKATGTEEVLRRLEKELRQKLEEMKIENQSLSQKARSHHSAAEHCYVHVHAT